jgi:hypothetical protein|tara:strand:+ start:115 stop:2295 length:2181 start_codon:yes stop_codon:yes gene_type:complete
MLQKLGFLPGFNKQVTETGAEGQWFGGDNVRFRYGTPEKIGGWDQLGADKLTGPARAVHHFDNNAGVKYSAIGTSKILYIYYAGTYYDITPLRTSIASCNFSTTSGQPTVTVTFPSPHGMVEGDIITFSSVTTLTGSSFQTTDFEDKVFEATQVPTSTTIELTMASNETTGSTSNVGSATGSPYYHVGPNQQLGGYGWGTANFGGTAAGIATTTLSTTIASDAAVTTVVVANSTAFPSSGEIRIGTEDISYTNNDTSTGTLSGGARAVNGTTLAGHTAGATVSNISDYVAWGESSSEDVTLDPGLWVLDNYGTKLIALIYNGKCFEWDSSVAGATGIRATVLANAPTASRHMLVSTPDRHLIFFGTETTIGDTSTQDDMYIRFSDQENIDGSTAYTVTANNTSGTQRLADGSKIMGAVQGRDAIYVWTDKALFLMRFVGAPFTFSFEIAGTNCGLIGKNAAIEVDGTSYWMAENGFFAYDGRLKSLPCLVEDYVYDDINTTSRDLINCGLNNLFTEVNWFYCSNGSNVVDRVVTYNYLESGSKRTVWTTGSLARTAWQDSSIFDKPHATKYDTSSNASFDVVGNTAGVTYYYAQETGTDQVDAGGTVTAVLANIESGDFDITQKKSTTGTVVGMPDLRGDGEFVMRVSRFIPDFISQTGSTRVSLVTKNYPNSSATTTNYDITTASTKVDTRIRGRAVQFKVANVGSGQDWKLGTFRLDIHPGGRR